MRQLKKEVPNAPYLYRFIASAQAMEAAPELDDNSAEFADVINTAGNWVKSRDDKIGDLTTRFWKDDAQKLRWAALLCQSTRSYTTRQIAKFDGIQQTRFVQEVVQE